MNIDTFKINGEKSGSIDLSDNILIPVIDKNKEEMVKLINYKFENNLDFTQISKLASIAKPLKVIKAK